MKTQFITDDRGGKVAVVIPISEYEGLLEDVEDLASIAERRNDETVSLAEVKRKLIEDGLLSS